MRLHEVRHPVPAGDGVMNDARRTVGQRAGQECSDYDQGDYGVGSEAQHVEDYVANRLGCARAGLC